MKIDAKRMSSWTKSFCSCCGRWIIISGLVFFTAGCATVYNQATERKELILVDSWQEVQIGRSLADNIIKKKVAPLNNPAKQLALNRMGQRIVRVSDRQDIVYHFAVLDNANLNAFALPGGYIFIYAGLLDKVDEQACAAILAHEVAHVAAKHAVKRMQSAFGVNLLMAVALAGLGNQDPALAQEMAQISGVVYDILAKGYSRQDELFADRLAVKYLKAAQFDPQGMVRALEILNKEKGPGGRVFEILSTHPRMEERIKKVKEEVKKAGVAKASP